MKPFPILPTERLVLNQLKASDIPGIARYAADDRITATTQNLPSPYREEDAIFWLNQANQGWRQQTQCTLAIRLKETEAFIGGIGLIYQSHHDRASLGYWLAVPFWGKGYTTEAAKAIIGYGFEELGLYKIFATHFESNPASGRVMQKAGMIQEAVMVDHIKKDGVYHNLIQYRLTKREWESLDR